MIKNYEKKTILVINANEFNCSNTTIEHFKRAIYHKRVPVVLKNVSIGPCIHKWTPEYLANQIGEQIVKVHVSTKDKLDFINKNFIYRSMKFSDMIKKASETYHDTYFLSETEMYYLRSLGENPRKDVSDIQKQFPTLCKDINFPPCYPEDRFFSSVFRISSLGIFLWTHYDIMDNILIQVTGCKRCVLFPPSDIHNLYLNGDKSEILDIDNPDLEKFPNFRNVEWHECILQPGDILFIPAMWFHNMKALDFSIAVNVFWKHLDDCYYNKKDIYGNKDLVMAANSFIHLEKALKCIAELPEDYRKFYGQRLIARIQEKLNSID